jgi:hypothetical protein
MSHKPGNSTLVVGGDFLDILEHVAPEENHDADLEDGAGHSTEFAALANAVMKNNLHVVYLRGDHDIRMLDSSELVSKKPVEPLKLHDRRQARHRAQLR